MDLIFKELSKFVMRNRKTEDTAIKVFLMGGAGNEFFQIARANNLSLRGKNVELLRLGGIKQIIYKLIGFTNHGQWIDVSQIAEALGIGIKKASPLDVFVLFVIFVCKKTGLSTFFDTLLEKKIDHCNSVIFKTYDVGYFQTARHIERKSIDQVAEQIIGHLDLSPRYALDEIVAHVRGGDVLYDNQISDNEAKSIIQFCEENSIKFSCVTNDIDFVKSKFRDIKSKIHCKGSSPLEDFKYLSTSKTSYLSNSTFAFWAAVCASRLTDPIFFGPNNWSFNDFIQVKNISNYKF